MNSLKPLKEDFHSFSMSGLTPIKLSVSESFIGPKGKIVNPIDNFGFK
jgi:hypothetical protein